MKNTFAKILLCAFALLATSVAFGAPSDVISSVTCESGTTKFTITRSTTTYPTTVYYRTINGSAVGGIHFQEASGSITFAAGESSKTVTITQLNVATSSINAYGTSANRNFRLQVWNSCTSPKYATCTLNCNTVVSKADIYDKEVGKSQGYNTKFSSSSYLNYQVAISTLENSFSTTRRAYLDAVGKEYRYMARVAFSLAECGSTTANTKWQFMIHNGSSALSAPRSPGDGAIYATFTHVNPSVVNGRGDYLFPASGQSELSAITNPYYWNHTVNDILTYQNYGYEPNAYTVNSKYYMQMYRGSEYINAQLFSPTLSSSASYVWCPIVYMCLKDDENPTLKAVKINNTLTYASGDYVRVALVFDEIVTVKTSSFSIPVEVDGAEQSLTYSGGSGTNTLYFYFYPTITSNSISSIKPKYWYNSDGRYFGDWFGHGYGFGSSYGEIPLKVGQKYTVTLEANGGTINCNEINSYTYGVGATLPTNVTRTGYTFAGWYTSSSGGSKYNSISTTATGNKTYYAHWTANTYTVALDNQSATSSGTASVTATYDSPMPTITVPAKKGYTFNGYYSSTNGQGTKYYKSDGTSSKNYTLTYGTTLYASWTVKKPTITLNNQSATTAGTETVEATYGANLPTITVPTRTGYTFGGYYTGTNGSGTQYYFSDGTGVMKSDFEVATTLYAKWTVNTYTVTLDQQSATTDGTKNVNVNYGSAMPSITLPKRTGYTFGGFYTSTGGSGTQYYTANGASARSYTRTSNVTLYAKWTKDTYTITYVNNKGTINGTSTTSYQFGNTVTLPTDVTRDGCSFGGWYNNANCEGDQIYTIASDEVGNKTFYAKWTPNTYVVRLHPGEGHIQSGEVTNYIYGVGAILPTASSMLLNGMGFAGWYDNPEFEGDAISEITVADFGEKDFYALWEENTYPVVLNTNEGIINSGNVVSYKHGTEKLLPSDVTRTGYTFEGWYENSSCIGTAVTVIPDDAVEAKTFWAKWREQVYDIAFEPNEGTINDEVIPTKYTFSVGASLPANVTRNGFAFAGWYDNAGFEGQSVALIRSSDYGNKTYYANWNRKTYTITFNNNGGDIEDEVIPSSYLYEEEVTLPSEVFKDGYEFLGWYDNPNFYNDPISKIEKGDFGNKTFYAKWLVESYDVVFVTNGGKINSGNIAKYTYGVPVNLPTDVTCTGYTFAGWCSDEALTSDRIDAISLGEMGIKTFYAKWTNNSYAITLNPNEGVIRSDNVGSYVYGSTVELPTDVVRVGYTFKGWFTNPSYMGSQVLSISATDYGDKEFWAKWTVNDYTVTLNTNGGTILNGEIDSYTYGVGATLPTAKNFVKTGATFGGWYADEDFSSSLVLSIPVNETGNKEFWAKWTDIDYTITYNVNEGQFDETPTPTYTYGGDTVVLLTPTREGYTFGGWFSNSSYLGSPVQKVFPYETGDKEFWAKWNVNSYSITFEANGGTINSGNVKNYVYGTTVVLPSDVVKTGYTFDGWYDNDEFSGEQINTIGATETGNKIYYANWIVNTYNITLVTNEGTIAEEQNIDSYEYNKGETLPTDVTKEGYTFAGWYTNSSYIGGSVASVLPSETGDKTFYAKWTVNEYKVSADYDKVMGTVTGEDYYEYKSTATLKAIANEGYEFVGWNDNGLKDERIQLTVTKDTTLTANFKEKEKVQIAGSLDIPTLKTEREAAPIDLNGLFTTTEGGEVTYTASSSAPNVVSATVSEGKLFLTVYEYEGEAEITVTATLPNGEKNFVKATAEVILACNIQVEETITNVSCYGESDGEIALKVTNAAEPYTTQWQGQTSTEDTLRNVTANAYTVVISDNENCSFTKTYSVTEPEEMKLSAKIKHPTCDNADGSITITLTGAENASFSWSDESTNQNIANLKKGDYSVVITNTETGCQISDSYTLVEPEAPVISVATTVATACNEANGAVYISTNSDDLRYMWSNSKTTKNLENVRAGDYTLEVVDSKNCKASLNVTIPSIKLKQPEIALVTVSQQSGKNLVVWLKENTDLIDYYTIYRVDSAKNKYDKVVDVPYSELSVYEDLAANPMERAWKYKMTATDVCGEETAMSDYHSSLHLMKVKSLGVENHLMWDPYEGIDFDSYVILRKTKVKGVVEIDTLATVPSDLTSYTDTLPARGTTSYYVGVKLPEAINPKTQFLKAESGPFSIALSNIAEVENYVAVQTIVKSNAEVYAIGHTIYVKNAEYAETAVYDVNGSKINFAKDAAEYEFDIKLDGVYLVKVGNETFKVVIK